MIEFFHRKFSIKGQLHFRFKILNNSAIPFSIFTLLSPVGILAELPLKGNPGK